MKTHTFCAPELSEMKPTHGLKPFHDFTPNERPLKAVEAKLASPLKWWGKVHEKVH